MVASACNPYRSGQIAEFEVSLVYTATSKPTKAKPIIKKEEEEKGRRRRRRISSHHLEIPMLPHASNPCIQEVQEKDPNNFQASILESSRPAKAKWGDFGSTKQKQINKKNQPHS